MLHATDDAAFTAAAAGKDRWPVVTVVVDGGAVDVGVPTSVEIERTLDGTEDSALLGGAVSGAGKVVLTQQRADGALPLDIWHPASTHPSAIDAEDQPGMPLAVRWGFDGQTVPGYGGSIRTPAWGETEGTVTLDLTDASAQFGALMSLPAEGSRDSGAVMGDRRAAPVNSAAVAALVFAGNGFPLAPPPRAGCIFSLSGVGGWLPDVGWVTPTGTGYPPAELTDPTSRFVPGPCGPAQLPPITSGEAAGWVGHVRNRLKFDTHGALLPDTKVTLEHLGGFGPDGDFDSAMLCAWVRTVDDGFAEDVIVAFDGGFSLTIARNGTVIVVTGAPSGTGATTSTSSAGATAGLSAGWHYVEVSLDLTESGSLGLRWHIDGVQRGTCAVTDRPHWSIEDGTMVELSYNCAATAVQAVQLYLGHWWNDPTVDPEFGPQPPFLPNAAAWTPAGDVSVGLLDVDCLPVVQDVRSWDLLKDLAAAEFGTAGLSEDGRPFWRNRDQTNPTTIGAIADANKITRDIGAMAGSVSLDDVRNAISLMLTPQVLRDRGVGGETPGGVLVSSAALMLPPLTRKADGTIDGESRIAFADNATTVVVLELDRPVVPYTAFVSKWQSPGQAWDGTGIVFCTDIAGANRITPTSPNLTVYQGIRVSLTPLSATRLRLAVSTFGSTGPIYAVWPQEWSDNRPYGIAPGQPSLIVHGWSTLTDDETAETTVTATAPPLPRAGEQTLELTTSPWWTRPDAAQLLVDRVLVERRLPRPVLEDITVPADPRRQIGDVLQVDDTSGRFRSITARVVSVHRVADTSAAFLETLSLRALTW